MGSVIVDTKSRTNIFKHQIMRRCKEFFEDILTPAEYKEIGKRWQIVKQLAAGRSQRDVAKNLHTGIATVTRGSRELLNKEGGFQRTLDKISKK